MLTAEIYRGRKLLASLVPNSRLRAAPGEHDAGNQNLIADFQRADFFFGEGEG